MQGGTGAWSAARTLACQRVRIGSETALGNAPRRSSLTRHTLAGALLVAALVGLAFALVSGLGNGVHHEGAHVAKATPGRPAKAITAASAGAPLGAAVHSGHASTGTAVVAGAGGTATVAEVHDPEEVRSFPLPASTPHKAASTPRVAGEAAIAPGAASDAEIRRELREEERAKAQEKAALARATAPSTGAEGGSSVGGNGTIPIPAGLPEVVQRVIAGGNAIADFPYIWGGGHGSFVDHGYDCSGSVSYALAAGGLLSAPLVSGELASWGDSGPGRWITIYANAGHTFMNVDGVWFDTAGRSGPYASRWITATPSLAGYSVRHPPGL